MSDPFFTVAPFVIFFAFILFMVFALEKRRRIASLSPEERAKREGITELAYRESIETQQHGQISPQFICPHCQTYGLVRTKPVKKKKGISGGKATAALLTGGVSMLATGLSRKEALTEVHCGNCSSTWMF